MLESAPDPACPGTASPAPDGEQVLAWDEEGVAYRLDRVAVSNPDVAGARAYLPPGGPQWTVQVTFTAEGQAA